MKSFIAAACTALLLSAPALAGPAGDTLKQALNTGSLADGLAKLEPMAASGDTEAAFGVGAIKLTRTIQDFTQGLWKHGFQFPRTDSALSPGMTVTLPTNPSPEPFDYNGVRQLLGDLVTGLDDARASFEAAGKSGDYVIELNPLLVRVDVDGDGKTNEGESLAGLLAVLNNATTDEILHQRPESAIPAFDFFGLDRADAYWLAGYSDVFAAQADFLLAHNFSSFTNAVFHRFFPKAGFPMQDYATGGTLMFDPNTDTGIADLVAAIHTISWPVVDPARLAGVRERLKSVLAYSRQNWDAILAETDDDHEWVPSPKQTGLGSIAIDDEKIAAWRATLDEADRVLDGTLLIPHWRFKQGFDLKAYFESARQTDFVMILTGYGALPFLKDGPVASQADFREMQKAFGDDWLGYAFYFN